MKKVICLIVALIACSGCAMLPQMQNWNTKDQILGGIFITECIWDGYETKRDIFDKRGIENNPFAQTKKSALIFGVTGMYLGLKTADLVPAIRTPLLILLGIAEYGGTRVETIKW